MSIHHVFRFAILSVAVFVGWTVSDAAPVEDFSAVEQQFKTLPMEARRLTGPLFWLHGDDTKERLELELQKVAEGGNGCFTAESRPHRDWLGEGWYRDLGICLDEAKRLDMTMWIFDEKWWPSGEVGGKVPQQYASKYMDASAEEFKGPGVFSGKIQGDKLIAVIAGRKEGEGTVDGASLVDLTAKVANGEVKWDAPAGTWSVMTFTWRYSDPRGQSGYLVDGASRDAADWYIKTVYQPHYDRFPDDFGKTIAGYFYDEPETHGDWGTEVIPLMKERGVDWMKPLVAWKFALAGEEQTAAKYQYAYWLAEAWGKTLYGGITQWCNEHRVKSIGHFLEHNKEYLNPRLCAGDMVQLLKYSDMGAIDAVFTQFIPGKKDGDTYQTPKLGSSISHAYGKQDDVTMVEIFGARGQDLTYPEMKWWTDVMQVAGVNFMIPHSFNPWSPMDTDCPPYFYNGGYEPRYPLYRVWADYSSRITLMMTGGRHVCPVAFLYLGQSAHMGESITPEDMTTSLQDALFDCDWIPYDVFENDMNVRGKELALREESYKVLIVPATEVIPHEVMVKAKAFYDAGGIVIGYGILPKMSATLGKTSAEIAAIRNAIWGESPSSGLAASQTNPNGGRSYFLPKNPSVEDIQRVLTGDAGVHATLEVIEGKTANWLHVLHRAKAGRDVFLVCNEEYKGDTRPFTFRVHAKGEPECWDPMRNEIASIPFVRVDEDTVDIALALEPLESVMLVFQPEARNLACRIDANMKPVNDTIQVERVEAPAPELPPVALPEEDKTKPSFDGCSWVWYPEGDAAKAVPGGTRYFRGAVSIPTGQAVSKAEMLIACDNEYVLYVNGKEAGRNPAGQDTWRAPATVDVKGFLIAGSNVIAVKATNLDTGAPNPAGLIGKYTITLADGALVTGSFDDGWRVGNAEVAGWEGVGFDDSKWEMAKKMADYGAAPWGMVNQGGRMLTFSPIKAANPFAGVFSLPETVDPAKNRVFVEMDAPEPEAAARITVNDSYAGGMIGGPFRLDITQHVHAGENRVLIEPFAPKQVRIGIY